MATTETVTSAKGGSGIHPMFYGEWTSETSAGDHTITLPYHVAAVYAYLDTAGTNTDILFRTIGMTETTLLTGSTGVTTTPAHTAGIQITNNSDGTSTVVINSDSQTASGLNAWIAWTKV